MKSIIFEASSVAKAIEQSWIKVGKPQNFSVKILEHEEKNFLGMTKKPAKIAFFFEEKVYRHAKFETNQTRKKTHQPAKKEPLKKTIAKPAKTPITVKKETPVKAVVAKKLPRKSLWTDQMIDDSTKWTTNMVSKMDLGHIKFSVNQTNNNIKFHFEKPLIENVSHQKELFRNLAALLMQTLRYKFKKSFRNLKIIFTSKPA